MQTEISKSENLLNYKIKILKSNYFAFEDQKMAKEDKDKYFALLNGQKEFEVDTLILNESSIKIAQKLSEELSSDDNIYIKPFFYLPFESNPFTSAGRASNIDFAFTKEYKYVTLIDVAPGYTYECPPNMVATSYDNMVSLKDLTSYNINMNKLTVTVDFKINKTGFLPEQYDELKASIE